MNKKQYIFAHPKLFGVVTRIYNVLNLRNSKIHVGCNIVYSVSRIDGLKISCHGKNNHIYIGNFSTIINTKITIWGNDNTVIIGDRCRLNNTEIYFDGNGNSISIGFHTHLSGKTHLAAIDSTRIDIGDECLFAREIHFRTGDSHPIYDNLGNRINKSADIKIGNKCWIGYGVTCLKGVVLQNGTIVGASTTLTKGFEKENCIIAGVPGNVIKENVTWSVI